MVLSVLCCKIETLLVVKGWGFTDSSGREIFSCQTYSKHTVTVMPKRERNATHTRKRTHTDPWIHIQMYNRLKGIMMTLHIAAGPGSNLTTACCAVCYPERRNTRLCDRALLLILSAVRF
jgi:hypothetical protein